VKADEFLKWGAILGGVYLAYEIVQKLGSIGHTRPKWDRKWPNWGSHGRSNQRNLGVMV